MINWKKKWKFNRYDNKCPNYGRPEGSNTNEKETANEKKENANEKKKTQIKK